MMTKFDPALSIALGLGADGNGGISISRSLSHASILPGARAMLLAIRRSPACSAPEGPGAAIGRERG